MRLESYNTGCDEIIDISNNGTNHDAYIHKNELQQEFNVSDDEIFCDAEDDSKSMNVEIDGESVQFIDTETEDSEEYDSDTRVLSPRKKVPPIESLEEMLLKHEFTTFSLKENDLKQVK